MQGNTPITPLLAAGIKTVLVTHLSDGSLWSRHNFPAATILEIRPQSPIQRDGGLKDLLGFDTHKIPTWIKQGYEDTLHCVGRVIEATSARHALHISEAMINDGGQRFTQTRSSIIRSHDAPALIGSESTHKPEDRSKNDSPRTHNPIHFS